MHILDVLEQQGRQVVTAESELSVEHAIDLMTRNETTAVLVSMEDAPAGIFTERDVLHTYVKCRGRTFSEIPLKEVMTEKLVVAKPDDEIDDAVSLMIRTDIRHLPVVENGAITAMLYLCDLLYHRVGDLSSDLRTLEEYLHDLEEARRD